MEWTFNKERLVALRELKGLSQDRFASMIGTVKQHISQWETGETKPNMQSFLKMCKVFKVEPKYFFTKSVNQMIDDGI